MADGFFESILVCILSFYFLVGFDYRTGMLSSYMEAGALCFTVLIIVMNLKVGGNGEIYCRAVSVYCFFGTVILGFYQQVARIFKLAAP